MRYNRTLLRPLQKHLADHLDVMHRAVDKRRDVSVFTRLYMMPVGFIGSLWNAFWHCVGTVESPQFSAPGTAAPPASTSMARTIALRSNAAEFPTSCSTACLCEQWSHTADIRRTARHQVVLSIRALAVDRLQQDSERGCPPTAFIERRDSDKPRYGTKILPYADTHRDSRSSG